MSWKNWKKRLKKLKKKYLANKINKSILQISPRARFSLVSRAQNLQSTTLTKHRFWSLSFPRIAMNFLGSFKYLLSSFWCVRVCQPLSSGSKWSFFCAIAKKEWSLLISRSSLTSYQFYTRRFKSYRKISWQINLLQTQTNPNRLGTTIFCHTV